jgi:hypothetical protein
MWHQVQPENGGGNALDLFDPRDRIAKLIRLFSSPCGWRSHWRAARALDRVLNPLSPNP